SPLSDTFTGGTPTCTCQWLQKAPGATTFSNLGTAAACTSPASTSTGALTTTGTWTFELQVTDSSGTPVTVTSATVTVTVGAGLTVGTPTASPTTIDSGQSSTLSDTFTGGTSTYTCQWLQKAPGATVFSNLGTAAACTSPSSISSGALTTTGTWTFELQVTDGSGTPVTVTSATVTVTVNTALTVGTPTA